MSNTEYYVKIESLLENQILSLKKMSYIIPNCHLIIKNMSELIDKTRELKKGTING